MRNISTVCRSLGARKLLLSDLFLASLDRTRNFGLSKNKGGSFGNISAKSLTNNTGSSSATTNRMKSDYSSSSSSNDKGVTTSSVGNADKWAEAIHPFQEPYWTGREDPSDYLSYLEESTLPQLRQRRRKHDLILLRKAEQVVWQVDLMKRAYQEYVSSSLRANGSTVAPCDCSQKEKEAAAAAAEAARQRYNDYRQEALDARMEFMRFRRIHVKGKNHYKYAMENFPIPEALPDSDH